LVRSLLQRVEKSDNSNSYRLSGPISDAEYQALLALSEPHLATEGSISTSQSNREAAPAVRDTTCQINLVTKSIAEAKIASDTVILALDFGTAMSKAFATDGGDENLLSLALGRISGHTDTIFSLSSSIFITDDGKVYFGPDAINKSMQSGNKNRKRFDSPKQHLSQSEINNLFDSFPDISINPTSTRISCGDLLTLYLAYFTDMACSELENSHKKSRYVKRRFTLPHWRQERAEWADKSLREMLSLAQILADTLSQRWHEGLAVDQLKNLVDAARALPETPTSLITQGVYEATAAATSCFKDAPSGRRSYYVIVDVGAGTTDFAAFCVVRRADSDRPTVSRLSDTLKTLTQAGDTIDTILRNYIIKQTGLNHGDSYFDRINTRLSLEIRSYKEILFKEGILNYVLADETTGEILLENFLKSEFMERFTNQLHRKFKEVVEAISPSWHEELSEKGLNLVFTGGGATMPMVKDLANLPVKLSGLTINIREAHSIPNWFEQDHPELLEEFNKLAVCIGATADELPRELGEFVEFTGNAPPARKGFDTVYRGN
ncbi:hypothetical protein, partial [Thalassospira sp.]|uniref:hypothetical protein n=1 Tax=Thalassospira sp. TaxID=1912094 RepID=UPI00311DDFC5